MESMHASLSGSGSTLSHVEVPTVGPAAPRPPHIMAVCSVKNSVSRNNHPLSLNAISEMVKSRCPSKGVVHVIVCVENGYDCGPIGGAIARAFPLFNKKTSQVDEEEEGSKEGQEERVVHVTFLDQSGKIVKDQVQIEAAKATAEGVRLACRLVGKCYIYGSAERALLSFEINVYFHRISY